MDADIPGIYSREDFPDERFPVKPLRIQTQTRHIQTGPFKPVLVKYFYLEK